MHPESRLLVYSDGASRGNPGPAAIGYAVFDEQSNLLDSGAMGIGEATNNVAEFKALLLSMDRALARGARNVTFHSDSEDLVRWVNGRYAARKPHIKSLLDEVNRKRPMFLGFELKQLPRTDMRIVMVDGLVNKALDMTKYGRSSISEGL